MPGTLETLLDISGIVIAAFPVPVQGEAHTLLMRVQDVALGEPFGAFPEAEPVLPHRGPHSTLTKFCGPLTFLHPLTLPPEQPLTSLGPPGGAGRGQGQHVVPADFPTASG